MGKSLPTKAAQEQFGAASELSVLRATRIQFPDLMSNGKSVDDTDDRRYAQEVKEWIQTKVVITGACKQYDVPKRPEKQERRRNSEEKNNSLCVPFHQ